ncbi:MAG: hypothetical protein NW206_20075 [Hyphomonadaceae bacterium]|nr:hypothetical protein [Hyphomonadaceae bacterium]
MTPWHFVGQERVLEAPSQWDHKTEGECGALPIRVVDGGCLSVWKPSPEELATLNAGGAVTSWTQGPQRVHALGVCGPESLLLPE